MKTRSFVSFAAFFFMMKVETASPQIWNELVPASSEAPAPRRNAAAIYDTVNHRMVIFGGRTEVGDRNDVWALDLSDNTWSDLTPASGQAPAPRFTANSIYDPDKKQMIIWSGQGATLYNDVWAFDLTSQTWSEFEPPDPKPNVRYGTASIFDPAARKLVAFAGFTNRGRFEDTWRFDVDQTAWVEAVIIGAGPEMRCLHSASYDARNHRMIIYGGQDNNGALRDLWAFDLQRNEWTNLTPPDRPAGRWFPTNIYDHKNHRAIIFGGNLGSAHTNEVWAFDLSVNVWQQLEPEGNPPAPREGAAAIYVQSEDRMIIFGGRGGAHFQEVWSLSRLTLPVTVEDAPPATQPAAFRLVGNFPNPFNPATMIVYDLPQPGEVVVKIYDVRGGLVKNFFIQNARAGRHQITWDGTNDLGMRAVSGVYLYVVQFGSFSVSKEMVVLK